MISRARALTTASLTNDPVSARMSATIDVKTIALSGRAEPRMNAAEESPAARRCSASANNIREPLSTWPALLPVIETTEPTPTSSAPAAPRRRRGRVGDRRAVRREVRQHALRHDLCERHDGHHRQNRRDEREWHVAARVERFAGRNGHDVVAAVDEDHAAAQPSRTARSVIGGSGVSARRFDVAKADDDEERERQELADGERVDQPARFAGCRAR